MKYRIVPVTPFEQNAVVLWCEHSRHAALVDPGGDTELLLAAIDELGLSVEHILLTHGHIDHVGGAAELAHQLKVPIEGPQHEDAFWLDQLPQQAAAFGFPACPPLVPNRWLAHGDTVAIGNETLQVLHTPGHTPGHVCFFHSDSRLALVGDVLFAGSIGRTDFPRGEHRALITSIRERLWPLGDDVRFIPGHGPMSSFAEERRNNPYVADGV